MMAGQRHESYDERPHDLGILSFKLRCKRRDPIEMFNLAKGLSRTKRGELFTLMFVRGIRGQFKTAAQPHKASDEG